MNQQKGLSDQSKLPFLPHNLPLPQLLPNKRSTPEHNESEDSAKSSNKARGRWRKDEHERFLEGSLIE